MIHKILAKLLIAQNLFSTTNLYSNFDSFEFDFLRKQFSRPKKLKPRGKVIIFRTYNYDGLKVRRKGLCLSFRSRMKSSNFLVRSRPFSVSYRVLLFNPNLVAYVFGEDGIRTHGH